MRCGGVGVRCARDSRLTPSRRVRAQAGGPLLGAPNVLEPGARAGEGGEEDEGVSDGEDDAFATHVVLLEEEGRRLSAHVYSGEVDTVALVRGARVGALACSECHGSSCPHVRGFAEWADEHAPHLLLRESEEAEVRGDEEDRDDVEGVVSAAEIRECA